LNQGVSDVPLECGAVTIHFLMQELTRPPTLGVELGLS
jgi:hypothetical protein